MKVMQTKKVLFKNTPTHSNQQLATPCEQFCTKLLSDCKEFDADISCTTTRCLLDQHVKISGTLCCKNLSALGIRNALQSIEFSIQVQFSKFLYMLNTLHYQYNTTELMLSLPYIWHKDKWSAFEIQQGLEHHLVSSGMHEIQQGLALNETCHVVLLRPVVWHYWDLSCGTNETCRVILLRPVT